MNALARIDIVTALMNIRTKYPTKKEADENIIEIEKFAAWRQRAEASACPFNAAKQENHFGMSNWYIERM